MGAKVLWVLAPLIVYALLLVLLGRGRVPSRLSVNMHGSLLLMVYLLSTAGLGIFWVANQQLPVFDWHYLFGYVTLLLVGLHLVFNLPMLVRWLRAGRQDSAHAGRTVSWLRVVALPLALGLAFWAGVQVGEGRPGPQANGSGSAGNGGTAGDGDGHGGALHAARPGGSVQDVLRYHEHSSESRTGVFRRAPVLALEAPPPAFKAYPDAPHIALERGAPADDGRSFAAMLAGPAAARELDLKALGQILYLSAGVTARRGGVALRAAPSSGALFPAELYVAVRNVRGLQAGLYHYDADRHRLEMLGEPGALPESLASMAGDAEALILLAAVFDRTAWKYRNRAFRYVAADLGHLLENVRLAAHYAGQPVHLPVAFDEAQAIQALQLDAAREGVLAVAALGGASVAGTTAQVAASRTAAKPAGSHDLHAVIGARRSQRRFAGDALALNELHAVLADMAQQPLFSPAVRIDLVVNRVAGLKPGIYRYHANQQSKHDEHDESALKLVREGAFAASAQAAALAQDVIGNAAVVLVLSADRAPMFAQGPLGYKLAFLEAGMMGQRWLLGATARGLAACPVGAFYDDQAAALVQADPQQRWVLHFAALGRPAP